MSTQLEALLHRFNCAITHGATKDAIRTGQALANGLHSMRRPRFGDLVTRMTIRLVGKAPEGGNSTALTPDDLVGLSQDCAGLDPGLVNTCMRHAVTLLQTAPAAGSNTGAVAAATPKPAKPKPTHNADFTMVNWYGTEYTFSSGLQAGVVKELWHEWETTGLGLHQETIRERIDATRDNFRLTHVFRSHAAYRQMIQSVGKGEYRLVNSDKQPKPKKTKPPKAKPKHQINTIPTVGYKPRALKAKQKIDAEYAAAHPDDD